MSPVSADPHDVRQPVTTPDALVDFVSAGVFEAADVHVARALSRACGDGRPEVLLAAALAVRAPRRQHVCADLERVDELAATADAEFDAGGLGDHHAHDVTEHGDGDGDGSGSDHGVVGSAPLRLSWPEPAAWRAVLVDSPMVAVREPRDPGPSSAGGTCPPLTLAANRVYLDRMWRYEQGVATALRDRALRRVRDVDVSVLRDGLDLGGHGSGSLSASPDRQRLAEAIAVMRHLAVIAGGPGTGKTTAVARILALLDEQAARSGAPMPRIALAAPTGKAAQRLTGSLREAALRWATADMTPERLLAAEATTIHRLLGTRPDSRTRFRHHRGNPLPHDVVVVDETSMVSLSLFAKLLEALRHDARLILLGDPEQLASVEAGSVLGDIVGAAAADPAMSVTARDEIADVVGRDHLASIRVVESAGIDDTIVVLDRVHRFRADSGIAHVAAAIQSGDQDAVVEGLRAAPDIEWIEVGAADADLRGVRTEITAAATAVITAANDGDGQAALSGLDHLRVLCAHRHGAAGVSGWVARIERWLSEDVTDAELRGRWYIGRPVLITENDHRLKVANGDIGVVIRGQDGTPTVALTATDGEGVRTLAPARLPRTETVHAMTVHKSQGSQFSHVVLILPDATSPLLTRELLYTALTRGRSRATVVGTPAAVATAVDRRAVRASGLNEALRG